MRHNNAGTALSTSYWIKAVHENGKKNVQHASEAKQLRKANNAPFKLLKSSLHVASFYKNKCRLFVTIQEEESKDRNIIFYGCSHI